MLSPYRVLDLTDHRGHLAGLMLATLGADVVKIEPPSGSPARRLGPFTTDDRGEPVSLTHVAYDRGKRSVVLDLTTPQGRDRLLRLAAGADVLIESETPGTMDALDLGYADLAAVNPALVYLSVTPFGQDGPKARWPVTDLTLMASACTMAVTGDADRPPVRVSVPQAFHFGAAVGAGAAIVALIERARSGLGQHVDVSCQQVIPIATQGGVLAAAVNAPVARRSAGGARTGNIEIRLVYPAKDGFVSITHVFGAVIGPLTARLMAWVHEEGFCSAELAGKDWVNMALLLESGAEPMEDWEAAKAAVAAFTASHTKAELLEGAMERRLLMAPIASPADVVESPHLAAREYFAHVAVPDRRRPVAAPGPFAKCSATPLRRLDTVARLGEHTEAVLTERGRRPAVGDPVTGGSHSDLPLSGLKVVDFMWSLAGPFSTRALADNGATVIKIESATKLDAARGYMPVHDNVAGAENSALFDLANAGKLSLTLNMARPGARDVALDLIRWADVVCESFSPKGMRNWGLAYEQVAEVNPGVIMVSTCLAGQTGPLASFAGYGNLGAAFAGFYGLAGWPDRIPAGPFGAYTDYTSTHLLLATILAAVDHRRRTGEGQHIDLSQAEAAINFLAPALLAYSADGTVMERAGNRDPHMAPHGVYPVRGEDEWIAVACQDDAAFAALCAVIGRPDLGARTDLALVAGRLAAVAELDRAVATWTCGRDGEQAQAALVGAGVAAHRVHTSPTCLADPQLVARGHWVEVDHPTRRCLVEGPRFRLSRTPGRVRDRAPFLGEHTFEVLTDLLGYDGDRIADLAAAEVLE